MILALCSCALLIFVLYAIFQKKDEPTPMEEEVILPPPNYLKPKLTESYLTLDNYIGQERAVDYIKLHVGACKKKAKPLPHTLLWGSGGLGKSTLMKAVAHAMGGRFIELVPANLSSTKELQSIFFMKQCACGYSNPFTATKCMVCKTSIKEFFLPDIQIEENDIIFLEECHGLKDDIEEMLYSLMQDGYIMLRFNGVDQQVPFPPITIAGATTLKGNLNQPFRDRFKLDVKLEPYKTKDMVEIAKIYINHKGAECDEETLLKLAEISTGVPRIIKKYSDDLMAMGEVITFEQMKRLSSLLELDERGLTPTHKKILEHIHKRMKTQKNGGAGPQAIAKACGLKEKDFMEFFEPALIYHELIYPDSRGRRLTDKGLELYFPGWYVTDEGRLEK